jgi:phosphate transport system permease protein
MTGVMGAAAVVATMPLIFILFQLDREGASAVNLGFFTRMPAPVGQPGGGMAHAIVGTLILVSIAGSIGLPVGIGAGLYLAEQRGSFLATLVRFLADVLNGLPSIVMGIFAWQFLVRPVGHFSALAGGVALGAMMVPLVTRATEEMVRTVPVALREAALALGYPRWRTSVAIVLRTALPGIVTAALVAVARIAGETAPLLFTAFGNNFWSVALDQPIPTRSRCFTGRCGAAHSRRGEGPGCILRSAARRKRRLSRLLRQTGHRHHRSIRLREINLAALSQPDA